VDDYDWVPIEFPPNLMEMMEAWLTTDEPNVGWCFLCNQPIKCEDDLIPESNTHNCPEGRALEETHNSLVAGKSRKSQPNQCGRRKQTAAPPTNE
jgi:hypothetical protein